MNKNLLILLLMALLAVMAAVSLWYSYQYGRQLARLSVLHLQHNEMNRKIAVFQALLNDTLEYSKRNPAIEPVLQAANLKWKGEPGATAPRPPASPALPKPSK
jgi:hypothetical protein